MHSYALILISAFLAATPILALKSPAPKQTDTSTDGPDRLGWTPKPTSPARLSDLKFNKNRRQADSVTTICGYYNGNVNLPYSCDPGNACAYNTVDNYFGCCLTDAGGVLDSSDCAYIATPYTGCYDYTVASNCVGDCYLENRVWWVSFI